jgi:hypothetical protein
LQKIDLPNLNDMKNFLTVVFIFSLPVLIFAQEPVKTDTVVIEKTKVDTVYVIEQQAPQSAAKPLFNQNKMYFGGYVNASFGDYTVIGIEPLVGYKLTRRLSIGGKFSYEYISDKRDDVEYNASNYGFSVFSRMRVSQRVYAHTEYSMMNYKLFDDFGNEDRKWVPFLFLGGGISQPITSNTWLNAEVLFDVLQNENSPYKSWEPFFSVGFGVGF